MANSMTLITVNEFSKAVWVKRIVDQFGDKLRITAMLDSELPEEGGYFDDLILITHAWLEPKVVRCLSGESNYIVAKRTLDLKNIHRLAEIPAGSDVIVLNDRPESCFEIIEELKSFGFRDYRYFAYGQDDLGDRAFQYAITDGEGGLMPDIPFIIDMGMRQISFSTIGEISKYFYGKISLDQLAFNRYIALQIRATMDLYRKSQENHLLQSQLAAVVSEFDEGVLVFNRRYEKIVANDKVEKLLPKAGDSAFLRELVPQDFLEEDKKEFFFQDGRRSIYISLKRLSGMAEDIFMATLSDMSSIRKINKKYMNHQKKSGLYARYRFEDILGKSRAMETVITAAKKYAKSDANVLIVGESGTGKELLAQSIHNASPRAEGPFVAINCGALSDALLESELFGYEEGAFTGASKGGKQGLFELAHQGTLFLDEIGNASPTIQQKLLRAIQEKEIFRISGTEPIWVDVRVISATNRNLAEDAEEGVFRRDLFYRLNVMTLRMPPLRERGKDIVFLFKILLYQKLERYGIAYPENEDEALLEQMLERHRWYGNVREMENLTEVVANGLAMEPGTGVCQQIGECWSMIYGAARPDACEEAGDTEETGDAASVAASDAAAVRPKPLSSGADALSDGPIAPGGEELLSGRAEPLSGEERLSIQSGGNSTSPEFYSTGDLVLKQDTEKVLELLKLLERDGKIPGRSAVHRYCCEHGIALTEQQIKLRIQRLRELELIRSGPGYGGTMTEKGEFYLKKKNQKRI